MRPHRGRAERTPPKRRAVRSICVLASAPATRWRQRPRTLPPRPVAAAGVAPGSGSATHDELCGDAGRRCIADRPPARELDSRPNGRRTPDRAAGGGAARCTSRRPPQHGGFLRQQQCARRERAGRKYPTARRRVRCCQDQKISRWLTDVALSCEPQRHRGSLEAPKCQCQKATTADWNALWLVSCSALLGSVR